MAIMQWVSGWVAPLNSSEDMVAMKLNEVEPVMRCDSNKADIASIPLRETYFERLPNRYAGDTHVRKGRCRTHFYVIKRVCRR